MLSRVADSLYWMSRYLERSEHCARVVGVNLNLMLDHTQINPDERWQRVIAALGFPVKADMKRDVQSLTQAIAFDPRTRSSISSCVISARENARQVREQISSEMWEQINRLFFHVKLASTSMPADTQLLEYLESVKEGAHLFQGLTDSTMTHGDGWHFIQFGRFLERASASAALLDVYFSQLSSDKNRESLDHGDHLEWIGLLRSCTAFEAYCKVYTAEIRLEWIAEFLILNPEFPHAIRFSVDQMSNALEAIARTAPGRHSSMLEKMMGRLRASLSYTQIDEILEAGPHAYLENIQKLCDNIHSAVFHLYIGYPIQSAIEA